MSGKALAGLVLLTVGIAATIDAFGIYAWAVYALVLGTVIYWEERS